MDRPIVYVGSVPRAEDFFALAQQTGIAVGNLANAVFGTQTVINGLGLVTLGTLGFQVAPGSITNYGALEATAYGLLPADTTDSLVKMGINVAPVTVTPLTAPTTAGQSINYLVEVKLSETDSGSLVLPYYNSANPSVPFSGPANSGTAQNTIRTQRVSIQVNAGAAAATGTQTTPATDTGWTALAVITVNYGQTSLTQGQLNAAILPTAPLIPARLGPGMVPGFSNVSVFSVSGNFVVPAGVTKLRATTVGGGAGGGGSVAGGFGSGGGGGGYALGIYAVTPGQSIVVTIGAAGVPGTSIANGGNGSTTSFGSLVSATGGSGGASNSPNGGQGGAGVSGMILQPGEWGRGGFLTGASQIFIGGEGGGTPFGLGARYVVNPTNGAINGVAGQVSGTGGSGGASSSGSGATVTGGAGAAGLVIVEY